MNAIYRRQDGRYSCCVSVNGRQKHLYGKSPEEVAAKRDQLLNQLAPARPNGHQLVTDFLAIWLEDVVQLRNKPSTYKSYRDMVRLHIAPVVGHYQLQALSPEHVQAMLNQLYAAGLAPRTVRYAQAILHRALNVALRWGHVSRNVAALAEAPRQEKYQATALESRELEQFFAAVRGHRLEALYWLALVGLRRGELLALTWSAVDLVAGTVQIVNGKTLASARTLPLSPSLVNRLQAHRERQAAERAGLGEGWQDHNLVFPSEVGTPIVPRNLLRHFKAALARAGLPDIRFHDLRHTAATLLLQQGSHPKTTQTILGHSNIAVTMEIYSHVSLNEKRAAVESLEVIFKRLGGSDST